MDTRNFIAKNIAALFEDGDVVNLGVGIPTAAVNFLPKDVQVIVHAECGTIGCGRAPMEGEEIDYNIVDATSDPVTLVKEGSCVDSAMSFGIVRGGHLSYTVLGAMQVDQEGNIANWIIPGKAVTGMGGAMDLVVGAKKVVVAMTHNSKDGGAKILKKCTLPLTAMNAATYIVTELALMEIKMGYLLVTKMADGVTKEQLISKTEATLVFADNMGKMVN